MTELISDRTDLNQPFIVALLPAYNESKNIGTVIVEVSKYVNSIIVVDDGSSDKTKEIAAAMKATVIRNKRNMGKGFSLKRGIIESLKYNPDIIITLDADGQHDPADIPKLVAPIVSEEADVVIGSRYGLKSVTDAPRYRKIGLHVLNSLNRFLIKTSVKDSQSGYRAYNKNVMSTILKYDSAGYGVEVEQLAGLESSGYRVIEVPVTIRYQGLGITSKENPVSHGVHVISTIFRIAVERKPLRFFGLPGVVLLVLSAIPAAQILEIFNESRYFSLPLAMIALSVGFLGALLILVSFVFFALKRIRQREDIIATSLFDLLNRMKP